MSVEDSAAASPAAAETPAEGAADATASDASAATQDVKSTPAETSAAEGAKPSLFDAVKASLAKDEAPPASSANKDSKDDPTAKAPEAESDEEDERDPGELTEEDKKLLSAKTQARIRNLTHQRDELREPAERFRRIQAFQHETGVSSDEIVQALDVLALVRSNPGEALKRAREFAYNLSLSLGETLPPDIQDKVSKGQIDEATGRELALARVKADGFQQRVEVSEAERQAQATQAFKSDVSGAVNAWEEQVTKRDPDFAKKKPLIQSNFRALIQEGNQIKSKDDAVRLMKEAYKRTNDHLGAFTTRRPEVKTASAPAAPAPAVKTPKTLDEAIRGAFGAAA
jgi:hypothetical protein